MEHPIHSELEKTNPSMIPGAIILAGVLIAGAVIYSNSGGLNSVSSKKENSVALGNNAEGVPVGGDISDDDPFLGKSDAPVTIVEFSDFQCPFCRRLWKDTLPQIKEKYLLTGKARLVYRDFPLSTIHPSAEISAEAGECADEQGKFWEMHDKIFGEQDKLGVGTIQFGESELKQWAAEIGLSRPQFNNCLDTHKYKDEVAQDFNDGTRLNVSGTPATFINGRLISGAAPFAQFEQMIEAELKKVK